MDLAIGLPLRHQQELQNFLQALYDPRSPQFRQYLTPEQFTDRFGPTPADYQAVFDFARTNGFTVTGTHADRLLLEVSASAADVQRAFQITLRRYPHPTEARTFFAPDTEPSAPADLPIADISGLTDYRLPHPNYFHRRLGLPEAPGSHPENTSRDGSGPNGNFIGSDYRKAYAPGTALTGAGQTVGVFEYDNYYTNDILHYESKAGLTNPPPVQNVYVGSYRGKQGQYNGEVALDVEMAMSMAPGLAGITCYEASQSVSALSLLSQMASGTTVKQFSTSWTFGSVALGMMDVYFQKMAAQGQTFFAACGDSGAYNGDIQEPDDDPNITVVGGAALMTAGPNGPWSGEITWNAPDIFNLGSGGISGAYSLPSWQSGLATAANQASTTHRNVPDVAMVADNIFIVADNGQNETSGGTSASAPLWAAYIALVNQQSIAAGHGPVGFINPALYSFYSGLNYSANFNDITYGNNTNSESLDAFFATPGYDLCSGLGSPTPGLFQALASPDSLIIAPGGSLTADGPIGGPFNLASAVFTLTNSGAASLNWSVGNQPAWLKISPAGGTLGAGDAAQVTASLNIQAAALVSNVYTANLWFTNVNSGISQLRQFTLRADQPLAHDGGFESFDFAYWTASGADVGVSYFVDDGTYSGYTPHSGLYFAALGESNTVSYLSQPLTTIPGLPYLVSFWLGNPSGTTPSYFEAEFDSVVATNVLYRANNLPSFNWENKRFLAVASSTNSLLQFASRDDFDYLILDDVSVTPVPLPTIQSVQSSAGSLQLNWLATPGLQYQVQSTPSLAPVQWTALGSPITAAGSSASATVPTSSGVQGYYRVVLLPPP